MTYLLHGWYRVRDAYPGALAGPPPNIVTWLTITVTWNGEPVTWDGV